MAINTNAGIKSAPSSSSTASAMAAGIASSTNDLIELNVMKKTTVDVTTTPILKRTGGGSSKRLQFSTPEFSVTPIATVPGVVNLRLIPSRKR